MPTKVRANYKSELTMATNLCKPRICGASVLSTAVRGLYSSHFGGGFDSADVPKAHAVLSQVLVLSPNKSHVLLGKHKIGDYKDRWTGIIGEVQSTETPVSAAQRLLSDLRPLNITGALDRRAILHFIEADGQTIEEHEYFATASSDAPVKETESILPQWFPISEIPFKDMPTDDAVWYPQVLNGRLLRGTFVFDGLNLAKYSLNEVESL